jgi:hypothetical protein
VWWRLASDLLISVPVIIVVYISYGRRLKDLDFWTEEEP